MGLLKDIDNHIFTPNNSLPAWLRTSKGSYPVAGLQMPGIYSTNSFIFHGVMFAIALVIEIVGALLLAVDWDFGAGLGTIGAIVGSVGFIIDLLIAFIIQFSNRDICYFNNYKLLYTSDRGVSSAIEAKISSLKNIKIVGYFVILLVAGVKIYFFKDGFGAIEMPVVVMIALFLFAAGIHITCTEYVFAYWLFHRSAKSEFQHNMGQQAIAQRDIYTNSKLKDFTAIPVKCPHRIESTDEKIDVILSSGQEVSLFKSVIHTQGLITDNDIQTLCESQPVDEQKRPLALELLYWQLDKVAATDKNQTFINGLPRHRRLK